MKRTSNHPHARPERAAAARAIALALLGGVALLLGACNGTTKISVGDPHKPDMPHAWDDPHGFYAGR